MGNARGITVVGLLFLALIGSAGLSATITVDPNGSADFKRIQDAVNAASYFDTIVVRPGSYPEHVNYNGSWVHITSINPSDPAIVETTVIDGSGEGNVVTFQNAEGAYAKLEGVTIRNGDNGIHCLGGDVSPTIVGCRVISNGVGILCQLSSPLISSSTIADNVEDGIRGNRGSISRCTIQGNGQYGLQYCTGDVTNCTIGLNVAGGVSGHDGLIRNTLIHGNLGPGIGYVVEHVEYHCTVTNCTVVGNDGHGMKLSINGDSTVAIENTIIVSNAKFGVYRDWSGFVSVAFSNLWGNVLGAFGVDNSNLNKPNYFSQGEGMIQENPFFVRNGFWDQDSIWHDGSYHLMSTVGTWDPETQDWNMYPIDSPCLDRGDPSMRTGGELLPNGGIINMGAYGGTGEASRSGGPTPICTEYPVMDFNRDCKVDQLDLDIFMEHWLECNLDPISACNFVTEDGR